VLRALATTIPVLDRYAPLAHTFGLIVMIFGLSILAPLAVSHALGDGAQAAYDEAVAITLGAGALLWIASRRHSGELQVRDGFLLVAAV
jgi:trk system potassium uptake protein TrkH